MQSNNPVFRQWEKGSAGANPYGNQTYAGNGSAYPQYGNPSSWSTGQPTSEGAPPPQAPVSTEPMTIDSVVQKSAMTLGLVLVMAAVTWVVTPDIKEATTAEDLAPLYLAVMVGAGAAFILSLVNSFKRVISPALVLLFAAVEGVALGGLSKLFDSLFASETMGSIVVQAVVGTFAAFAGTLAAYKFFNIQVSQKFRTFVIAAMFGMVALGLMEFVLSMFGNQIGFFGFGNLGLLFAIAGLVLGVFMLILDFDFIEKGIAAGIPERESWRAAFALTVSLVWIYTNLLRILAILNQE